MIAQASLCQTGLELPKTGFLATRLKIFQIESVELALKILDGYDVRGHKITVEKANFQMKGDFDPTKTKKKLTNKEKRKFKEKQAK